MGELSRVKGISGETTAENFLKLIGWHLVTNRDIVCIDRNKHKCKTHGVDIFSTYPNPLESDLVDTVVCSVKNLTSLSESDLNSAISKLDTAASCAQYDEIYNNTVDMFRHRTRKIHLLFFCLLDSQPSNFSLNSKFYEKLKNLSFEAIDLTIVDNQRLDFLTLPC